MAMILDYQQFSLPGLRRMLASAEPLELSAGVRTNIERARKIVARYAAGDEPIYGLNTGLGGNLGFRVSREDIEAFQQQIIRGRNVGVGPALPREVCRAALLIRIISASKGPAGLSRSAVDGLVALFNAGVTPVIPAYGSIGAADLILAAHMANVLTGRGRAWFGDVELPASEALQRAGLGPVVLEPKDGLGLCNASPVGSGHGTVTLGVLGDTLAMGAFVAALSYHGYAANPAIFDARLQAARPSPGQGAVAALFRDLLAGSSLSERPRNIQDAVSFRTIAPMMGAAFTAFAHARTVIEDEVNGVGDTPLVLIDDDEMLSAPNFQTPALALALDTLAIALTHLSTASAYRIQKMMNPALSGLPKYLSTIGGASAGFVPMQKTVASLHAEIRQYAAPASLDSLAVSDTVEDHAPQTMLAVKKLAAQLEPFRLLIAIEALVASQAVDLREGLRLSAPIEVLHKSIRAEVPMLAEDRENGPDVMRVDAVLSHPDLIAHASGQAAAHGLLLAE